MAKPKRAETVAKTDFPLYTIRSLGNKHFLVAGGGGEAKTGVPNAIEVYEVKNSDGIVVCEKVQHHNTGTSAIMNCALAQQGLDFLLASGQMDQCHIYKVKCKAMVPKKAEAGNDGVRKRKGSPDAQGDTNAVAKSMDVQIEAVQSITSDFHAELPFQKAVQFTNDKSVIVTGGADGKLRAWKFPELSKLYEVDAHQNEIDDLDISPPGNRIVSVSRDHRGLVWNTADGSKKFELVWDQPNANQYRIRCCRFGRVADKKDQYCLYTAHISSTREKKALPCYITKWETKTYTPSIVRDTGSEILSSLAVSEDGVYLGVGTIQGSVSVHISFSLQKLYHVVGAHNIFVTGLDFLPSTVESKALAGDYDFSLLSISADNHIKMHQMPNRDLWSPLWVIVGFVLFIYLIFWLMSAAGI